MADIECWLGSCVIFRGSRLVLMGNPKKIVIVQGRGGRSGPHVPTLDPRMIEIPP